MSSIEHCECCDYYKAPQPEHIHISYECPYFDDDPEHYGYKKVYIDCSGGYDWNAVVVVSKDSRLYGWVGSGCSCNDMNDYLPDELEPIDNQETFMRKVANSLYSFDTGMIIIDMMKAIHDAGY